VFGGRDRRRIWPPGDLSACHAQAGPCRLPRLSFGREGFAWVQILKNRSASAKPLRETPPTYDHLRRRSSLAGGEAFEDVSSPLGAAASVILKQIPTIRDGENEDGARRDELCQVKGPIPSGDAFPEKTLHLCPCLVVSRGLCGPA